MKKTREARNTPERVRDVKLAPHPARASARMPSSVTPSCRPAQSVSAREARGQVTSDNKEA